MEESFLSKLPLEDQIDSLLGSISNRLRSNSISRFILQFESILPQIPSKEVPTPLGTIKTPEIHLPTIMPPQIDYRRKLAIKAAVGADISGLLNMVPGIGTYLNPLADALFDTYYAKIVETMDPAEYKRFLEDDKVSPSTTLAALKTFSSL